MENSESVNPVAVKFEDALNELLWEAYKAGGRAHLDVEHPNARIYFDEWLKELG